MRAVGAAARLLMLFTLLNSKVVPPLVPQSQRRRGDLGARSIDAQRRAVGHGDVAAAGLAARLNTSLPILTVVSPL